MEVPQETYRTQLDIEDPTNPDITEAVRNSPILAILVEEVRMVEELGMDVASYNRMHNRHNRTMPRRYPVPPPEPPRPEPDPAPQPKPEDS